jgi:hypothetical protein
MSQLRNVRRAFDALANFVSPGRGCARGLIESEPDLSPHDDLAAIRCVRETYLRGPSLRGPSLSSPAGRDCDGFYGPEGRLIWEERGNAEPPPAGLEGGPW